MIRKKLTERLNFIDKIKKKTIIHEEYKDSLEVSLT